MPFWIVFFGNLAGVENAHCAVVHVHVDDGETMPNGQMCKPAYQSAAQNNVRDRQIEAQRRNHDATSELEETKDIKIELKEDNINDYTMKKDSIDKDDELGYSKPDVKNEPSGRDEEEQMVDLID
jgi:hypothetical protein